MESSFNVIFSGNNIENNGAGICLEHSSGNALSDNNITANGNSILLLYSSDNTLVGNNLVNNEWGIYLGGSSDNMLLSNNIANKHYGIWLYYFSGNTLSGNNIANNQRAGIELSYSLYNTIAGNSITANNGDGIRFEHTANNNIVGNSIANNGKGVWLGASWDNVIYHNNFVNNAIQVYNLHPESGNVWDDGYPSGGNYWSNHVTVDDYSGIHQDELGSDGIVDVPYIIDGNNQDNYPLVNRWSPAPPVITATVDIDPDTLNLRSEGQWITAYIELSEGYNVSDIDVSTVMLNDTIPISLLDVPAPEPVPTEIGDYDEDGIPDLMVKFDRTSVQSFIYSQGITYGEVSLTITGELSDGTPFEGTDVIFVNYAGDANKDGMIDIFDIGQVSAHWYPGPPAGPLSYNLTCDFNKDEMVDIFDIGILSANWRQTTPQ